MTHVNLNNRTDMPLFRRTRSEPPKRGTHHMSEQTFLTPTEAAARRGCHPGTLNHLVRRGLLTRYRDRTDGRRTLYDTAELDALDHRTPTAA